MFFDNIANMLNKQNLSSYMMEIITEMKKNPDFRPASRIVQVVGINLVGDGVTNFPCIFKKNVRKGAFIRLTKWDLDTQKYVLNIHDFQLLSGQGYDPRPGKLWDTQKLKYINNSKLISNEFVVLHSSSSNIKYPIKQKKKIKNNKRKNQ